jgi:4-hydroxy-2-oxoheptanedioate aldolase
MTRMNKVIARLEKNEPAFGPFLTAGSIPDAVWASQSGYDAVVFEMEHNTFNLDDLRLSLQFMLDRKQILESGTPAPAVSPFVRVPVNGRERNQWIVKQVLDIGVMGIVFPMINTPEDAIAAIQACRYPHPGDASDPGPTGIRGHSPNNAVRYWGLTQPEYFEKADVWPLDPQGEILPLLQCETIESVNNLEAILDAVPNPGIILISESDLSVSLGHKAQNTPELREAVQKAAEICRSRGVLYGSPQVNAENIEQRLADGFSYLMPPLPRSDEVLRRGREIAARSDA